MLIWRNAKPADSSLRRKKGCPLCCVGRGLSKLLQMLYASEARLAAVPGPAVGRVVRNRGMLRRVRYQAALSEILPRPGLPVDCSFSSAHVMSITISRPKDHALRVSGPTIFLTLLRCLERSIWPRSLLMRKCLTGHAHFRGDARLGLTKRRLGQSIRLRSMDSVHANSSGELLHD